MTPLKNPDLTKSFNFKFFKSHFSRRYPVSLLYFCIKYYTIYYSGTEAWFLGFLGFLGNCFRYYLNTGSGAFSPDWIFFYDGNFTKSGSPAQLLKIIYRVPHPNPDSHNTVRVRIRVCHIFKFLYVKAFLLYFFRNHLLF